MSHIACSQQDKDSQSAIHSTYFSLWHERPKEDGDRETENGEDWEDSSKDGKEEGEEEESLHCQQPGR